MLFEVVDENMETEDAKEDDFWDRVTANPELYSIRSVQAQQYGASTWELIKRCLPHHQLLSMMKSTSELQLLEEQEDL